MKHNVLVVAVASGLLLLAGPAEAITNVENNSSIPFSFSNPGARSLGMGGAFLAIADDATAAYTNPAGLTGLGLDQQLSIELRRHDVDAEYASGGSASFDPFDRSGIGYERASKAVNGVSYLSWVLPRENWAFALYRHELVNYRNAYSSEATAFDDFIVRPYSARTDLDIVNYGASFGYNLNDQISIGAGVSWYDFEIDTETNRFDPDLGNPGNEAGRVSTQAQEGSDDDIGFNLGAIMHVTDSFNIGLSYRSAPKFDYRATNVAGPGFLQGAFTGQLIADKTTQFEAPDMFGVGFNWRPTDNLSLSFDLNRINYSNLSNGIQTGFFNVGGEALTITSTREFCIDFPECTIVAPAGLPVQLSASALETAVAGSVRVDDALEPRLGMEYVFADMRIPLFLRAGAWHEERHTLRMDIDPALFGDDESGVARANSILFSTGDDEMHYALGLGLSFETFQLDFATDQSDRLDIYSMSAVWRF
jgi:long-chain fatty acid transport protein